MTRVTPIPKVGGKNYKALGNELFEELYSNIFLCARKKSGKTTVIYNILKKCANKKTTVVFFVPTLYKDASYQQIIKMLDRKGIQHIDNTHFLEGKLNLLNEFINELNMDDVDDDVKNTSNVKGSGSSVVEIPKEECKIIWGGERTRAQIAADEKKEAARVRRQKKTKKKKSKRKKFLAPEYILVFDDLGQDLRNKSISTLLKKNRHYKMKVIMSSQWLNDLHPQSIRQLDYMLAFKGFTLDKLAAMHKQLDISTDFNEFYRYYRYATSKPYGFLTVDAVQDKFRSAFNERLN